ncbi:hypothetical protein Q8F55_004900 [Vanrija albida]|uniref:SCP domain-containing protein n=1 Tax=Vanrija albida TaxID=181172 RepID=A0ABR3Q0W3_9TREE
MKPLALTLLLAASSSAITIAQHTTSAGSTRLTCRPKTTSHKPTGTTSAPQPCGTCPQPDVLTEVPATPGAIKAAVVPLSDEQRRGAGLPVAAWDDELARYAKGQAGLCGRGGVDNSITSSKVATAADATSYDIGAQFKDALAGDTGAADPPQRADNARIGCGVALCSAGTLIDHVQAVHFVCQYSEWTGTTSAPPPCGTCPQPDVLTTPPLTEEQVKAAVGPLSDAQRQGASLPVVAWDDALAAKARERACRFDRDSPTTIWTSRVATAALANDYPIAGDWADAVQRTAAPPANATHSKIGCALSLCRAGTVIDHVQAVVFSCEYS